MFFQILQVIVTNFEADYLVNHWTSEAMGLSFVHNFLFSIFFTPKTN
jgi:hypothetical protein